MTYKEVAFMKRIVFTVTVALVMALILVGGAASAQASEAAVSVQVDPTAQAIAGGKTLLVTVEVACEPGLEVIEAHVSAQQEGATSTFAGIGGVVCDGKTHVHKVRVNALDGQFSSGTAFVSAFVLLRDPATGETVQGQHALTVSVVGAR
jgi:hypothetical protein